MDAHSSNLRPATDRRSRGRAATVIVITVVIAAAIVASGSSRDATNRATPQPQTEPRLVTGQPLSGLRAALAADDTAIDRVRA